MSTSDQAILQLFKDAGAFLEGHFLLTSGLHSPHYIEKFRVLEQPRITAELCKMIADTYRDEAPNVIVGPMTGGIILAHEVGKQLGVRAMFTERVDGQMAFRRGFALTPEDKVLLVEDIVTTGGSILEVRDVVKATGAEIVGLGLLVDRSGGIVDFGIPHKALLTLDVVTHQPDDCPLCQSGVPLQKPGRSNKK
ncbi:MAG: orotate phosphoribosyltransferase [Ectothiorhodospiraceae bacterium]|nr:orotate phosphoribosyltransferase [Ectothiorhodospiraceae bacterium]